jgi:hypothetical protein
MKNSLFNGLIKKLTTSKSSCGCGAFELVEEDPKCCEAKSEKKKINPQNQTKKQTTCCPTDCCK